MTQTHYSNAILQCMAIWLAFDSSKNNRRSSLRTDIKISSYKLNYRLLCITMQMFTTKMHFICGGNGKICCGYIVGSAITAAID